jgi:DNA repair protein NreA
VVLLPRVWGFDSIEAWLKGNFWGRDAAEIVESDWEDHTGRSRYASTAGGYYATRLSVLEHLLAIGRQATAIVHREVTDAYTAPLGVWVVRETSRLAMQSKGLEFEDLDAALRHVDRHALLKTWRTHAKLLQRIREQPTLDRFAG